MLEKYMKMLGLGKSREDQAAGEPEPVSSTPLTEVIPEARPAGATGRSQLVDTGSIDTEGTAFTSVLDINTHGEKTATQDLHQRYLGRLPILDRGQVIVGYELLLRNKPLGEETRENEALLRMRGEMLLKSVVGLEIDKLLQDRIALVNLPTAMLDSPLVERLPQQGIVVALKVPQHVSEEVFHRVKTLRAAGYRIALDDFIPVPSAERWLEIADYICFDVARYTALDLSKLAETIQEKSKAQLMACNVKTLEDFEACRHLPFHYFQGYYFTVAKPDLGGRIENEKANVLELLNQVRKRAEISELEKIFKRDPALSYNLLRYINSPGCGMLQTIRSIAHALIILGYEQLYRWLTLLLFTAGKPDERAKALLKCALVRGRFTEILGNRKLDPKDREGAFIVGVFSLLDALLNTSLIEALKPLSLPDNVVNALLYRQGIYAPFLDLAIACEQDDQERIHELASQCGLDANDVNIAHLQALIWAEEVDR
jgi:EAL and modified HD-GYP domain-containing signal transduction protein